MSRLYFLIILIFSIFTAPAIAAAEEILIHAVGDLMLAGRWAPDLKKSGYDYAFGGVTKELAKGDINIANLESPISTGGTEFKTKKFRFRAEPQVVAAIRKAGFNLVTLANNHTMDFGGKALVDTIQNLEKAGIVSLGAGKNLQEARKMALYKIKGKKVAFLGYSLTQPIEFFAGENRAGTAPGYERLVVEDVARAHKEADYVVVSFHWGTEATGVVRDYQRRTAHAAIDAGADVIIGHHPHVLQGIERYRNGIIFYSLGNFTFVGRSKTADVSAIIRLTLADKRKAEILPLDVLYRRVGYQPKILSGKPAKEVIERLNKLSRPFKTVIDNSGDKYVISF